MDEIKKVLEGIKNESYVYSISPENLELVKNNKEFCHYLTNGLSDGSGGLYPFMTELCKTFQPKHVVELGNREGLGVLSIFEGIKDYDAKFSTIDVVNDLRFVPKHIKESNKVDFIFGDVLEQSVIDKVKKNGPIDLILCDTIHTFKQIESEWIYYEPLFNDKCIALIDDVYYDTKHLFFNKIKYEKFVDYKLHSTGFGVVMFERKEVTDEEFWSSL